MNTTSSSYSLHINKSTFSHAVIIVGLFLSLAIIGLGHLNETDLGSRAFRYTFAISIALLLKAIAGFEIVLRKKTVFLVVLFYSSLSLVLADNPKILTPQGVMFCFIPILLVFMESRRTNRMGGARFLYFAGSLVLLLLANLRMDGLQLLVLALNENEIAIFSAILSSFVFSQSLGEKISKTTLLTIAISFSSSVVLESRFCAVFNISLLTLAFFARYERIWAYRIAIFFAYLTLASLLAICLTLLIWPKIFSRLYHEIGEFLPKDVFLADLSRINAHNVAVEQIASKWLGNGLGYYLPKKSLPSDIYATISGVHSGFIVLFMWGGYCLVFSFIALVVIRTPLFAKVLRTQKIAYASVMLLLGIANAYYEGLWLGSSMLVVLLIVLVTRYSNQNHIILMSSTRSL
jgi:hypothetical protein